MRASGAGSRVDWRKRSNPVLFDCLIAQKEFTVRKLLGVGSWFFGRLTAALQF